MLKKAYSIIIIIFVLETLAATTRIPGRAAAADPNYYAPLIKANEEVQFAFKVEKSKEID